MDLSGLVSLCTQITGVFDALLWLPRVFFDVLFFLPNLLGARWTNPVPVLSQFCNLFNIGQ